MTYLHDASSLVPDPVRWPPFYLPPPRVWKRLHPKPLHGPSLTTVQRFWVQFFPDPGRRRIKWRPADRVGYETMMPPHFKVFARPSTLRSLTSLASLYRSAEVWGSCGQLASIEKIQLRAARIFLGVGRLHPKVSLFELNTLPLKWEGMKRCIEFWVKVMRMGEDRLLKQVMMQVMELGDGVQWRQDL